MGETLSSAVGGAIMVILAVPTNKLIEVIVLALIGGALGAFAKKAGEAAWYWVKEKYNAWREKR